MTAVDPTPLRPFGWSPRVAALLADDAGRGVPGRVVRMERGWARVRIPAGVIDARFDPLPAVGDWVIVDVDTDPALVLALAQRWSALTRVDPHGDKVQVLAANVDLVVITCPADRPSVARVEREVVVAWDSGAQPLVVVTKVDVGAESLIDEIGARVVGVDVVPAAVLDGIGTTEIASRVAAAGTAVVLGPSGAGKSTLVNALLGEERFATGSVRDEDARGRHTTTTRDLVPLPSGGVIIDTPGLRGLGLADAEVGLDAAFSDIVELAAGCRFRDCAHDREPGCAVVAAVEAGDLHPERFASYRKLAAEVAFEARREDPVAARAERDRWKAVTKAHRRDRPQP